MTSPGTHWMLVYDFAHQGWGRPWIIHPLLMVLGVLAIVASYGKLRRGEGGQERLGHLLVLVIVPLLGVGLVLDAREH